MNRKVLVENRSETKERYATLPVFWRLLRSSLWPFRHPSMTNPLSGGLNLLAAIRPGREIWTPLWGRRGWGMERNLWSAAEDRSFLDSWTVSSKPPRCWSVCPSTLESEPDSAVTMEPSPGLGLSLAVPWAQGRIPSCSVFSTASYRWKLCSTPEGC